MHENIYHALERRWSILDKTFPARFWSRVNVVSPGKCWNWKGGVTSRGYGSFKRCKSFVSAHRLAYELTFGPIQSGLQVCHHCDNPRCCNPYHLFIGTARDNSQDMIQKGRKAPTNGELNGMYGIRGSLHPSSKLDETSVESIKKDLEAGALTQAAIAKKHNVTSGTVSHILNGRTWTHVSISSSCPPAE